MGIGFILELGTGLAFNTIVPNSAGGLEVILLYSRYSSRGFVYAQAHKTGISKVMIGNPCTSQP